jgi:hypothetical protein
MGNIKDFAVSEKLSTDTELRSWDVEVFANNALIQIITVQATSPQEASKKAYEAFDGIKVKVKRHYN